MSKRVLEADVKKHLFPKYGIAVPLGVVITQETDPDALVRDNPWLKTERLVVKPNELFGRRGQMGLVKVNLTWPEAKAFITQELLCKEITLAGNIKGIIQRVLVERFIPHQLEDEFMVSIKSVRQGAELSLSAKAGIDVDKDWDKYVRKIIVPVGETPNRFKVSALVEEARMATLGDEMGLQGEMTSFSLRQQQIVDFALQVFECFDKEDATLVQINPGTLDAEGKAIALDARVELDQTAGFLHDDWSFQFHPEFGREAFPEEEKIRKIDAKSGASVKLIILNPRGRIWLLPAGGGGSIIYTDTVCDLGFGQELGNYAEYSGDPPEEQVFALAEQIILLMTRYPIPGEKKHFIVGGGIANFTNVKNTFKGIIKAMEKYAVKLREHRVVVWVRRGGPQYQEGLQAMREVGKELGLETHVFGPEDHLTRIVRRALGGEQ